MQTFLSSLGPFFVLLGLLIFVHELGHFLVAKWNGVRVEVFSLGFGKKILQWKKGDTTYCISLIPLGGYVKMYGDDPSLEIPEESRDKAFLLKPVGARIAVVLAGPLMNLFFAIIVFSFVAFLGERFPEAQLGDISVTSKAYESGFRSGDQILAVNHEKVRSWEDVDTAIENGAEQNLSFELLRTESNGIEKKTVRVVAKPGLAPNPDLLSDQDKIGHIDGLSIYSQAPLVANLDPNSLVGSQVEFPLVYIEAFNGHKVQFFRDLAAELKRVQVSGEDLEITYKDFLKEESVSQVLKVSANQWRSKGELTLSTLGFQDTYNVLYRVKEKSPAEKAGLKAGDQVISVGGNAVTSWDVLLNAVKSYKKGEPALTFTLNRRGQSLDVSIQPEMTELMRANGADENRFTIGIIPAVTSAAPHFVIVKTTQFKEIVQRGVSQSWRWSKNVVLGFVRMIQRKISTKSIGGVISIGKYAGQAYEVGLSTFLNLMGIISINLFILNLLPIPVLDGGHLMFFLLEAVRGAPLSLKKLEIAQQLGFIVLVALMAFALFNDISHLFNPSF